MKRNIFSQIFAISIIILVLSNSLSLSSVIYVSGDVSGVWSADTVIVTDSVRVPPGATLTIQPGVEVLFWAYCKFLIDQNAILTAAGTINDSILFNEYLPGNHWKGLRFINSSSNCRLQYCHVKNGLAPGGGGEDSNGGGIFCNGSSITIKNCLIDNCEVNCFLASGGGICLSNSSNVIIDSCVIIENTAPGSYSYGGGIFISGSNPTISNSTISLNNGGGAAISIDNSDATILNCTIQDNEGSGISAGWSDVSIKYSLFSGNTGYNGGGISLGQNASGEIIGCTIQNNIAQGAGGIGVGTELSVIIDSCTIIDNTSYWDGGGGIRISFVYTSYNQIVRNCLIKGNNTTATGTPGGGIYISNAVNLTIELCEISQNNSLGQGGGIYFNGTNPSIRSCTIVDNVATDGGGVYSYNCGPILLNSILWGNYPDQIDQISGSTQATYSDIQQFWPGSGNINADPLFVNSTAGDYHLTENSPCIDAGDPNPIYNDPDSTRADMGCYYYDQSVTPPPPSQLSGNLEGTLPAGTYNVVGDIFIQNTDTLIIEPGAELIFDGFYEFKIFGYLEAVGTEEDSIKFTANPTAPFWNGVWFNAGCNNNSIIEYAYISGAIATGATPNGGALYFGDFTCPTIRHCTISGNHADGNGGAIAWYYQNIPTIEYCLITDNSAGGDGGGIHAQSEYGGLIDHCTITDNSCVNPGSAVYLRHQVTISNSIIADNTGNSALHFYEPMPATIEYNDFYNNAGGNFSGSIPQWVGNLITVNANGDSCDLFRNILLNPQFYSTTGDSAYYLSATSPCIDAGNPSYIFDPDSTVTDMGCYYYDQSVTPPPPSQLSGNLEGLLTSGTYTVIGNISVNNGDSLIIQPGTTLKFNNGTEFDINGYLYAVGTEEDSIKFIRNYPDSSWGGIDFNDSANDSSRLGYCHINGGYSEFGGGIYCNYSSPAIFNCTIAGNSATGDGGGVRMYYSNAIISNCIIKDNYATLEGGGINCVNSSDIIIKNCVISNNSDNGSGDGIFCGASDPEINNCTISGNNGNGVYLLYSNAAIINTIINNHQGYGITSNSSISVTYCDLYNNENFGGNLPPGLGIISTVNANGDSCDIYYNIFLDPQFEATAGDSAFRLLASSPCIDAGDPASPLDPDGTIADIGAYYYDQYTYYNSVEITGIVGEVGDQGNFAALDSAATDEYDPGMDIPEPPAPPNNYLKIYFPHSEWGCPLGDNFMVDVRNANDDLINAVKIYHFHSEVDSAFLGQTVNLTFNIGEQYPANYGAVLDYLTGTCPYQNLRENSTFEYTATTLEREFNLRLGDGTPPVVNITFPTPNISLYSDSTYIITWITTDCSPMRYTLVYYSLDGGGSWTLIDTVFTGVTQCPWTTPAGFYPNSRVKVEATDVAGNVGSDEVGFYIGSDIPQVEIHFPVEGMLIYSDSTYQLNWLSTCTSAINNTLIEYSLNDGLVWDTLYNLPGGSDTTRPWTTPDSFSVYARIKITAYNLLLIPGSDTVSFDLAPDYMEAGFPAGWNLLSIPLTPPNNSINAVFGDDISGIYFVYNYSPSSGFGLVNQVATGVGYWLGLFNSAQVDITGEPELDTCYASVSAGWNMVGAGIPTAVSIDSLLFRHNNITYSYRDAVVNSLIYPTFWEYSLADYDTASALLPWGGYWLFALTGNLQMIEYPPYPGIGLLDFASIGEAGPTESNWQINIELQQGETGSIITALGVNEEATDSFDVWYDWVAPPVPPNGEYLRGVFYHQEWGCPAGYKFCRDFRAPFAQDNDQPQMEEWCLTLESSDPGLITVNFEQVLENLPAGYSGIVLYNDTTLNFRQAHYFDFDYVQPLPVTIRIFNRSATLLGWDLLGPELELPTEYSIAAIYPNPFNSRTVIKIGLPQACHLNLTLYNVLGRQVTILSDGYQPAGYHLFEFDGEGVSSGIYFVRAVSPSKFNQMKKIVLIK